MINWSASGIKNTFRYELVDAVNLDYSYGELEGVTGCKITESYYSDNRVAASLDLVGSRIPDGQAVRIWHIAEYDGERYTYELGTFLVDSDEPEIQYGEYTGTVSLLSTLSRYTTDLIGWDLGVGAVPIVQWFKDTVTDGFGTPYVDGNLDTTAVFTDWVWEFGKSTYWALNQAAGAINGRLNVDGHGRTVLEPYVAPSRRAQTFEIDGMYLERGFKNTLGDKCNRVVVMYQPTSEDSEEDVPAIYADVRLDAAHKWHQNKLKRWYTNSYTVEQLADATEAGVKAKAEEYLAANMSQTSKWEATGLYVPYNVGEVGRVTYKDAPDGISKSGIMMIQQKEYNCDAAMETSYVFSEVNDG